MIPSIKKEKILWIAWEKQRRSTTLAHELVADLYQIESDMPRLIRYIILSIKTFNKIYKGEYDFIFVQKPSIILAFLIVAIKKCLLKSTKVIIDAHTPFLKLKGIINFIFNLLERIIYNCADLVIITNNELKKIYEQQFPKASFFILPDKIPVFGNKEKLKLSNKINILLVNTYAEDEPYIEVIKAMNRLRHVNLYVTGDIKNITKEALQIKTENVILTGYLSNQEYVSMLHSVDIVMDLTDIENNMVCGAYEGVAADKPLILSKKKVLVEYFNEGVIHTQNDAENITKSIQIAIKNIELFSKAINNLKKKRSREWRNQWKELLTKIELC